jgi:hypothetical protein
MIRSDSARQPAAAGPDRGLHPNPRLMTAGFPPMRRPGLTCGPGGLVRSCPAGNPGARAEMSPSSPLSRGPGTSTAPGPDRDAGAPVTRPVGRPVPFDTSVPNVARMYNYLLGGKDNFAA